MLFEHIYIHIYIFIYRCRLNRRAKVIGLTRFIFFEIYVILENEGRCHIAYIALTCFYIDVDWIDAGEILDQLGQCFLKSQGWSIFTYNDTCRQYVCKFGASSKLIFVKTTTFKVIKTIAVTWNIQHLSWFHSFSINWPYNAEFRNLFAVPFSDKKLLKIYLF